MSRNHSTCRATASRRGSDGGFSLIETLIAMIIVLVVSVGIAAMYGESLRANTGNAAGVQLLSSVRAKVEQIQSIPYMQVAIKAASGTTGPAYFSVDPVYAPVYDATNGDVLLSDTVTLKDGTQVTRTVTATAVDDAADGTGANDVDDVNDPNTSAQMDYKRIDVTGTLTKNGRTYRQTLSTFLRGDLPEEIDGATGKDEVDDKDADKIKKVKKKTEPPPPPPEGCEIVVPPPGKKPGKKGTAAQTGC